MEKKLCAFDGCGKPSRTRGFCQGHYCQFKKGQELRPIAKRMRGAPIEERFMSKLVKTDSCWEWISRKDAKGYGRFTWSDGREFTAHRAAFLLFKGEIPADLTVDHICQNTSCANPGHLRLATWTQQAQYKRRYARTSQSGIRNVHKAGNGRNGYAVYVTKDGVIHYGGYFMDIHEADTAAGNLRAKLFDFKEMPIE